MNTQWDAKTIKCILLNPIYKGYPVDNQISKAKTTRLNTDIITVPLTEQERDTIRIIDIKQWDRINKYLEDNQTGYKRLRRANLDDFWGKCFLFCGNCQDILYIANNTKWKPSKNYRCEKCGAIKADVIHEIIDSWLNNWLCQSYISLCEKVKSSNAHEFCGEIAQKMYCFILSHLPGNTNEEKVENFKKRKYTATIVDDYFEVIYQEIFDENSQLARNKITELKAEKQKLILKFIDIDDPDIKEFIKGKQNEIELLETNLVSLVPEYRRCKQHLLDMASTIRNLSKEVMRVTGEEKAMLLRPYLKDVTFYFDNNKKNNSCKVCRVEINAVNPFVPKQVLDLKEFEMINEKYNGRRNCRLGKSMSEETRQKLSESKKKIVADVQRNKLGQFVSK